MEIRNIGAIPPDLALPSIVRLPTQAPRELADELSSLLSTLALPDVSKLLATTDGQSEQRAVQFSTQLAAITADAPRVPPHATLQRAAGLAREYPEFHEQLAAEESLRAVNLELGTTLKAVAVGFKQGTEHAVSYAAEAVARDGPLPLTPSLNTDVALTLAQHFSESPRTPDLNRARALAEIVQARHRPVVRPPAAAERAARSIAKLTRRAPLRFVLAVILTLGLTGAISLEWCAAGLLAAVGLAFYGSVRSIRF